jgi:molecular chaperone GrpE
VTEPNEERDAAAGQPGNAEPTVEIPAHEREVARLRQERDLLEQQLQRTLADTANMRRRQKQEMDDSRHRVLEGLTQELLPVLDSFSMALQSYEAAGGSSEALVEGVKLVRTLLSGALERHGLQEIPAAGLPFDPTRHEAVAVEPPAGTPAGHVVRVLQKGYMLGDRVVRHSRVVVAGPKETTKKED